MPEEQMLNIAWAAGVYDYGGYVKAKNRTLYMRANFPIDRARADRFRDIIGEGRVYGPYRWRKGLRWQYELTGRAKVSRAIGLLRPYLTHPTQYDDLLQPRGSSGRDASSYSYEEAGQSVLLGWASP